MKIYERRATTQASTGARQNRGDAEGICKANWSVKTHAGKMGAGSENPARVRTGLSEHYAGQDSGVQVTYHRVPWLPGAVQVKQTQGKITVRLNAARKSLLDEQRAFSCVMGIGLKRLNDSEIVEQERSTIGTVRRTVKRSMRRLSVVNYDTLPPADQTVHRVTSATLGAIGLCVSKPSQLKLEQKARKSDALQVGEALKLFSKEEV